jgi:PAS domain-containing protein
MVSRLRLASGLSVSPRGHRADMSVEHQPLLLVQGRNLITNLALPALLTDSEGRLLYFNDAAAALLGRRFEEVGRLPREEWAREIGPFDEEGRPLAADSLPLAEALRHGHPAQGQFHVFLQGELRDVEVTALPLVEPDNYEGALIVFWPSGNAEGLG